MSAAIERLDALLRELSRDGISDPNVLAAIRRVPREAFIPPPLSERAYENVPLPIGEGQTISQPFIVAVMTEALALSDRDLVLEVGTGSGYQTAILAELSWQVVSVERQAALLDRAARILSKQGYHNVDFHFADGSRGWPARAPYDRIIVTAGGPVVPTVLLDQLAPGGRLVMPIGSTGQQRLVLLIAESDGLREVDFGPVHFVPLIGEHGWAEQDEHRPAYDASVDDSEDEW
ncbi:MAG: protein-L-isoaspartate(D-aspartate) O-methyltransferase [Chloroflexi bacterium]|nr:protein-L-isoaspartate(D-aspartate) O-methyltransferase [Chloroflexota bacterium]